ncbi:MAG: hypothetical protein AAF889_00455 [Cyanobacteria bacterium P01_D01_bin.73]
MTLGYSLLRTGSIAVYALCLSVVIGACGGTSDSDPNASVSSPTETAQPATAASPEVPASISSPSEVPASSAPSGNVASAPGDRDGEFNYSSMEILGATYDEGFNVFYEGWTERCVDPKQSSPACLKRDVVALIVAGERRTLAVDCEAKTLGDSVFEDGTYTEGMRSPTSELDQNIVKRACKSLMYKEGPVGEVVTKDEPAGEPAGEPGYIGYDVIGQTEGGADVYYISAQLGCAAGVSPSDCDRREVNLVIGESNSTAVVFCSTGNFNELTVDGTLVRYLMQPKTGVYADVVKRACAEQF